MDNNSLLLPHLKEINNTFKIVDGNYIKCFDYCNEKILRKKCQEYYNFLKESNEGFYTCPCGLSSYVKKSNGEITIYTCLREKNTYNNKKFSNLKINENKYNPILSSEQILTLIRESEKNKKFNKICEDNIKSTEELIHEIKNMNSQIKNNCEIIQSEYKTEESFLNLSKQKSKSLFNIIKSVTACSLIIHSRFYLFDYTNNPSLIKIENTALINIYKKFDKMRRILNNYKHKNINIEFIGNTSFHYKLCPSFEIVPFLILENAIKYSKKDCKTNVEFKEDNNILIVSIKSFGPYCDEEDINNIVLKGYRGKNVKETEGHGLGLYLVNELCLINRVVLSIKSQQSTYINSVPYGDFIITLEFNNNP